MKNKRLVRGILGLLVLQFVLGMLANLYATIPQDKPYEVFHQFGYILFHALNGTLLLVLGSILVFKSRGQTQTSLIRTIVGLVNLVLAFSFGELFVFTQNDLFSLLMAFAFIGALLSYANRLLGSHHQELVQAPQYAFSRKLSTSGI